MVERRCVTKKISPLQLSTGILIVCITLWFGWYPFNFVSNNTVLIDEKRNQALFNLSLNNNKPYERGMAYTKQMVTFDNSSGATFHFILTPSQRPEGLGCILSLYDGNKQSPLIIAQWQDHLALFNGVAGIHKKYQEVGLRDQLLIGKTIALTIATTSEATEIFIDGKLMHRYAHFSLLGNNTTTRGKIIIGNNMYGTEPWHGSIDRVTIYDHGDANSQNGLPASPPLIDYRFETLADDIVSNRAGSAYNLFVPNHFKPLSHSFFSPVSVKSFSRKGGFKDIFLNIIGFMPVSFCITIFVRALHQKTWLHFLTTIFLVFLFSLMIEATQAFLPSRISSQLDLFCNTFSGIVVALFFMNWKRNLNFQMEIQ